MNEMFGSEIAPIFLGIVSRRIAAAEKTGWRKKCPFMIRKNRQI